MTKLGLVKSLLPLFFLFFMLPSVTDAIETRNAYLGLNVMCLDEVMHWWLGTDQTNTPATGSYSKIYYPNQPYYLSFRIKNSTDDIYVNTSTFTLSCSGGTSGNDYCYASGSVSHPMFSCASQSSYVYKHFNAETFGAYPNCTTLFGENFDKFYGSSQAGDQHQFQYTIVNATSGGGVGFFEGRKYDGSRYLQEGVCMDTYFSNLAYNYEGVYYFVANYTPCSVCIEGSYECDVGVPQGTGNLYKCTNGQWTLERACLEGGYVNCTVGGSFLDCKDSSLQLLIANKERQIDRISITDQYGRNLQSSEMDNGTVYYSMFETQKIQEMAFRLLSNWTHKDWIIKPTDTVSIELLWNDTEVSCTETSGTVGSSEVLSYYYDKTKYNCTLMDGYLNSNMTVQANATLTSEGGLVLTNPVISRSFTVELVEDSALLDNFQIVWLNETTGAVSGHIIRLSDLADIPESKNPFAYVDAGFYSKYNSVYISGVSSGQINATDLNYLYWEFDASTINPNDVFFANVTVGADGFANSSYSEVYGKVAEQRILYFKCWNDPRNTSILNSEKLNTSPVSFVCSYQLADTSGVSMAELVTNTTVEKMSDLGFGIGANEDYIDIITGREYRPAIWYSVPYSSSSGYVLTYRLNETSYRYRDTLGTPQEITPSRYVGEWGKLDNPLFPGVMTHVDLYVDTTDFERFILFEPSFDQVTYYENDTAVFIAMYYDPDNLVRDWSFRIYTDSSHSYALDYRDTQPGGACYSNSSECIGYEILPIGMGVTELRFWVAGVQSCKSVSNVSGLCTGGYTYKFLDGTERGTLYGTLTVYKASDYLSEESQTAEATLIVSKTGDLLGSLTKGWPWWLWLIVIILGLIAILILIKMATK